MASASIHQRSIIDTPIPITRETISTEELSGGNNRTTARSLNTCPYLAISSPLAS
jgi:hypothetical protein